MVQKIVTIRVGTVKQPQVPSIYWSKAVARPSENAGFNAAARRPVAFTGNAWVSCLRSTQHVKPQRRPSAAARACCEPAERNGANWTSGARCWRRTTGTIVFRDCFVNLWMSLRAKSATKCSTFAFSKVTLNSGFKPKKVDRHSFKSYWVFGSAFSGFPRVLCLASIGFISLRSVWSGEASMKAVGCGECRARAAERM